MLAMNNIKMPEYEEIKQKSNSKDTIKVLILGNSITSHGIAPEIGWNHKAGMAASEENKDYVHLFFNKLVTSNPQSNIIIRYSNYSVMERNPESFLNKDWQSITKFRPDKLIFQLSDNVTKDKVDAFKKSSLQLLDSFKNTSVYIVSPFFVNEDNYKVAAEIAKQTNSTFIDITSISKTDQNKAINEKNYPAGKNNWIVEGIGQHPGNIGMANISNAIFKFASQK